MPSGQENNGVPAQVSFRIDGEAKPIELDTRNISEKISRLEEELGELRSRKVLRQSCISELNKMAIRAGTRVA